MNRIRIAHIVNPFTAPISSDVSFAQAVSYESIRIAKEFSAGHPQVELFCTQYIEDHPAIPQGFTPCPDLDQSVLDYGSFTIKRKLPIISEILGRLFARTDADYLIFTNADIGLLPHFYQTIARFIDHGHLAFTINRRTISNTYKSIEELPDMYSEVGRPHRGWDCFVFERSLFSKFILGKTCIGVPLVGLAMVANLMAFTDRYREFRDEHLTFHMGNDRNWHKKSDLEYVDFNRKEVLGILQELELVSGKFAPKTPPANYLKLHRNRLLAFIYDQLLMRVYIPAQYTRMQKFR